MFWRALFAFLALPGSVAYLVPLLLIRSDLRVDSVRAIGLVPVITGSALLLWCVRDFYIAGEGTLAPWSPPRHLVVAGLYRFLRNPMYAAVILILCGWFAVALMFHLRVVVGEEPWLSRTHGEGAWGGLAALQSPCAAVACVLIRSQKNSRVFGDSTANCRGSTPRRLDVEVFG